MAILRRVRPMHVVLSDYRMPGMNGIDFLRHLSRDRPETVGIIISGFADAPAIKQAIDQHAIFAFLSKPWESEEMRKTVTEAVARSLAAFKKNE
jgi:two-component system NtrC family sensor kinase